MDLALVHLRALSAKLFQRHENDRGPSIITAPRGLPSELLHIIVSYVEDQRDLVSLCKSCWALYHAAQTPLYKSITIALSTKHSDRRWQGRITLNRAECVKLYRTIRQRAFSNAVTGFKIAILECNQHAHRSIHFKLHHRCMCDKLDTLLGRALISLENLQTLVFECICCPNALISRHGYLQSLKTRQLRRFMFRCRCNRADSESVARIMAAPCMNTITSFHLYNVFFGTKCDDLASRLHHLQINRLMCTSMSPLVAFLLGKETVTHFTCGNKQREWSLLGDAIKKRPGTLLHLVLLLDTHRVPNFIAIDPSPYSSLRHFGVLRLETDKLSLDYLHKSISSLSILPNLTALQAWVYQGSGEPYNDELHNYLLDPGLAHKVRSCVPSLKKIYVEVVSHARAVHKDPVLWIWGLQYEKWVGIKVFGFDGWKIMHGEV